VRKVSTSTGKDTPGIDGITWDTPAKRWEAMENLEREPRILSTRGDKANIYPEE